MKDFPARPLLEDNLPGVAVLLPGPNINRDNLRTVLLSGAGILALGVATVLLAGPVAVLLIPMMALGLVGLLGPLGLDALLPRVSKAFKAIVQEAIDTHQRVVALARELEAPELEEGAEEIARGLRVLAAQDRALRKRSKGLVARKANQAHYDAVLASASSLVEGLAELERNSEALLAAKVEAVRLPAPGPIALVAHQRIKDLNEDLRATRKAYDQLAS